MDNFTIKDSGKRQEFATGMVRDTSEGKVRYNRTIQGPMFKRWGAHLEKGALKYPDSPDGSANWMKASTREELKRFKESAFGHFVDWLEGKTDEDHAAALFFNVNGAEYTKLRIRDQEERDEKNANPVVHVQKADPFGSEQEKRGHRSFIGLAVLALVAGLFAGAIIGSSVSSAGSDKLDWGWSDRYNSYQNSSAIRELQLQQERDSIRREAERMFRHPC